VVDRVVADHLEVLGLVRRGSVRVFLVEGVGHADAFDGILRDAVHHLGLFEPGCFENRRHNVDNVVELVANAALVLDHIRPGDGHALLGAAEVRATILVHENGVPKAQVQPTDMCG
jgi:hypothetical protein